MMNQEKLETPRVLIVGAGPAGLGVSLALKQAGVVDHLVIDAREVGAAFKSWPKGMSLLTPSFHSNNFGLTDLNAIDPQTSPADLLKTQHPDGPSYAMYLSAIVQQFQLPVSTGITVESVRKEGNTFTVKTSEGTIQPDYVVWAAGQFFHPRDHDFEGAEYGLHNSKVEDWTKLKGEAFTIIGGYESGVDAAINLVRAGKSVRLISSQKPWSVDHPDPSRSLSPRSIDRLRELHQNSSLAQKLELIGDTTITKIEKGDGFWVMRDQDNFPISSTTQPILANGFHSGLGIVDELFDHTENTLPIFSEEADESTITSGLFYSGPSLVHRNSLFCFIYKFRARFGVIASEIATRLGKPDVEEKMELYAKAGFLNKDLDCCTNCECAIEPTGADVPEPSSFG